MSSHSDHGAPEANPRDPETYSLFSWFFVGICTVVLSVAWLQVLYYASTEAERDHKRNYGDTSELERQRNAQLEQLNTRTTEDGALATIPIGEAMDYVVRDGN